VSRAWRGIRFGLLMILGGAVVSVVIAEGIAASGAAKYVSAAPVRFVEAGDKCIQAQVSTGTGWRCLSWYVVDPPVAALNQAILNHDASDFYRRPPLQHPNYDPPESLPRWARLWRPAHWPRITSDRTIDWGQEVIEVGVGWPLPAMAIDRNTAGTIRYGGGVPFAKSSRASLRFLSWRPILTGFMADTLLWSACLAGLVVPIRFWIRARRRRRWQCAACRYDLRGLAAGAVCPECGAAERATRSTNQA
jgi:hypothetical protein